MKPPKGKGSRAEKPNRPQRKVSAAPARSPRARPAPVPAPTPAPTPAPPPALGPGALVSRERVGEAIYAVGVRFAGIATAPSESGQVRYCVRYRPFVDPEATARLRSTGLHPTVEQALAEAIFTLSIPWRSR